MAVVLCLRIHVFIWLVTSHPSPLLPFPLCSLFHSLSLALSAGDHNLSPSRWQVISRSLIRSLFLSFIRSPVLR